MHKFEFINKISRCYWTVCYRMLSYKDKIIKVMSNLYLISLCLF